MYLENIRIPPPKCLMFNGIKNYYDIDKNNYMMYWLMFIKLDKPPYFLSNG